MMNNSAKRQRSRVISELMDEITPVEKLQASTKMALAARIEDLINSKGWSKGEFAVIVNKNPSEITKWLSGTQNFTIDTLSEIGIALNMNVAELLAPKKTHTVNRMHFSVKSKSTSLIKSWNAIPMTPIPQCIEGGFGFYFAAFNQCTYQNTIHQLAQTRV